jgi:hypothetical protein
VLALFGVYRDGVGAASALETQEFCESAKLFCGECVYEIDAESRPSVDRVIAIYSRTTKPRFFCGFVDFLMARVLRARPVPGNPAKVPPLNNQDNSVGKEQMPVFHRAHIQKRMPGH